MPAKGQTRRFRDVCLTSGLPPKSGSELWSVRVDRPARENRVSSGRCNKDDTATPCT
jgi:hypothetical protein